MVRPDSDFAFAVYFACLKPHLKPIVQIYVRGCGRVFIKCFRSFC